MKLEEYYRRNAKLLYDEKAYLEKLFVETVFHPEYGDDGLNYLQYQKPIRDSYYQRTYYIDFVVENNGAKYAIELDGYYYHGIQDRVAFEREREKGNEISRQDYVPIHYTYDKIKNHPDWVRRDLRGRLPLFSVQNLPVVPVPPPNPVPAPSTRQRPHVVSQPYQPPSKNSSNGCGKIAVWIIIILIILSIINDVSQRLGTDRSNSTNVRNSVRVTSPKPSSTPNFRLSSTPKPRPTVTPRPTAVSYMVYNPKDVYGAPFDTLPDNNTELLIRTLRNRTPIKIIGKKEFRNNYEWYHIRDDKNTEGWILAQYVTVK